MVLLELRERDKRPERRADSIRQDAAQGDEEDAHGPAVLGNPTRCGRDFQPSQTYMLVSARS